MLSQPADGTIVHVREGQTCGKRGQRHGQTPQLSSCTQNKTNIQMLLHYKARSSKRFVDQMCGHDDGASVQLFSKHP